MLVLQAYRWRKRDGEGADHLYGETGARYEREQLTKQREEKHLLLWSQVVDHNWPCEAGEAQLLEYIVQRQRPSEEHCHG